MPNVVDRLRKAADDESPLVRLMAIWAATFVPRPEAAEVVLLALVHPDDKYIDFLAKEAMRTLRPLVNRATAEHKTIPFKTQIGARYLLKGLSNEELLKRKQDRVVLLELVARSGLTDSQRAAVIEERRESTRWQRTKLLYRPSGTSTAVRETPTSASYSI